MFRANRGPKKDLESPLHGLGLNLLFTLQITKEKDERINGFMEVKAEPKTKVISDFKLHERDTGSADVQIALLTQRINHLHEHMQKNEKDHSSRRGLLVMVSQRRRLLDYLHNTDVSRYTAVTKKLKLRK